jgi:hypothetical protein
MTIALAHLRSRRGFKRALAESLFDEPSLVAEAFRNSTSAITRAWLLPGMAQESIQLTDSGMIGEILAGPMKQTALGSKLHQALVEAVRRLYKHAAIAADRADKAKRLVGKSDV